MKLHKLAREMQVVAQKLMKLPNVEVKSLLDENSEEHIFAHYSGLPTGGKGFIRSIVELSKIGKKEWKHLIEEFSLPIEIRARDATRDLQDKVVRYLAENPSALDNLQRERSSTQMGAPLQSALNRLLGRDQADGKG